MCKRDGEYVLASQIELDDGYFTTEKAEKEKHEKLKRGRGSQKKTKVLVMVESQKTLNQEKGKEPRKRKETKKSWLLKNESY